jgi:phenylalanyl-tRNA synthetase alpha chain
MIIPTLAKDADMAFLDDLKTLETTGLAELQTADTPDALEQWRIAYLGSKGKVKAALAGLKDVPKEEKGPAGKAANAVKTALTEAFQAASEGNAATAPKASGPMVDVTLPGEPMPFGHEHIITRTINEMCEIFGRMGFDIVTGPEVEDEGHNFVSLNIPASHPARDPLDNFYISDDLMLRSQTSTVQIRMMEANEPPMRIVSPGRVYRPDTVDATHSFMFHQLEGLYVDEGVSMADLKTCLNEFFRAFFGHEVPTRFRPSFFPFTEPSAEVDVLFEYDDGSSKWIEMLGCGMVDPNVLENVGYDSEKYTGYAFGMGVERLVMRKYNIPDIRLLYAGDARFLKQF